MTAFYMFRLWFLTFAGQPRDHGRRPRPRVAVGDDAAADRPGGVQRRASPGAGRCGTRTRATWDTCWKRPTAGHGPRTGVRGPTHSAGWLALAAAAVGRRARGRSCTACARSTRRRCRPRPGRCTASCATSGTSTSCTTPLFVRPAVALGYGTARFDKRSAPGGSGRGRRPDGERRRAWTGC